MLLIGFHSDPIINYTKVLDDSVTQAELFSDN